MSKCSKLLTVGITFLSVLSLTGCGGKSPYDAMNNYDPSTDLIGGTGDMATIGKTVTLSSFKDGKADVTIQSVTLNYYPKNSSYIIDPKEEGKQIVRVKLAINGLSDYPFNGGYTNFLLKTSAGENVTAYQINKENTLDFLRSQSTGNFDVEKDEVIEGALYFEAPLNDKLENLSLLYKGMEDGKDKKFEISLKK